MNVNAPLLGSSGYGAPRMTWCVLHNFALGEAPATAEMNALRPGSTCNDQNPADATYAPVVAQHWVAAPATAPPPPQDVAGAPGQVGHEFVLSVAEGVQTLLGTLVPGTTG